MMTFEVNPDGSWAFDAGRIKTVTGEPKFAQDVREILTTEFGGLDGLIGEAVSDQLAFAATAGTGLRQSFEDLAELHRTHRPDRRTPEETLSRVDLVQVSPGFLLAQPTSRVRYLVRVKLTTARGKAQEFRSAG